MNVVVLSRWRFLKFDHVHFGRQVPPLRSNLLPAVLGSNCVTPKHGSFIETTRPCIPNGFPLAVHSPENFKTHAGQSCLASDLMLHIRDECNKHTGNSLVCLVFAIPKCFDIYRIHKCVSL